MTLGELIISAPRYLFRYVVSYPVGFFSNVAMTTIILAAVALGLATGNVWWGFALLFTLQFIIRCVNNVTKGLLSAGRYAGQGSLALGRAIENVAYPLHEVSAVPPSGDGKEDAATSKE